MENRQTRRYGLHLFADTIENFKSALPHGSHIVHSRTEGDSVYVNLETSMTRSELLNFVHSLPDLK